MGHDHNYKHAPTYCDAVFTVLMLMVADELLSTLTSMWTLAYADKPCADEPEQESDGRESRV